MPDFTALTWLALLLVNASGKSVLPNGALIIGYQNWEACNMTETMQAVEDGVNVVIWFSLNLVKGKSGQPLIQSGPDSTCVAEVVAAIRAKNLFTAHLISIGGWNAPHPDTSFNGSEWFAAWHAWNQGLPAPFDGFDWDLEGNDYLPSQWNEFTAETLRLVIDMSVTAKDRGYLVTMAPAQSYLDAGSSLFNRSLRNAYPDWHPEFHYRGLNCYAYLVAAAPAATFDLVTVQLYESWSRASEALLLGVDGVKYLESWTNAMLSGFNVSFNDAALPLQGAQTVRVMPQQLVIGLSHGWGKGKSAFFSPETVCSAYDVLAGRLRGVAFWNIALEGSPGSSASVSFARGLNSCLQSRSGTFFP